MSKQKCYVTCTKSFFVICFALMSFMTGWVFPSLLVILSLITFCDMQLTWWWWVTNMHSNQSNASEPDNDQGLVKVQGSCSWQHTTPTNRRGYVIYVRVSWELYNLSKLWTMNQRCEPCVKFYWLLLSLDVKCIRSFQIVSLKYLHDNNKKDAILLVNMPLEITTTTSENSRAPRGNQKSK